MTFSSTVFARKLRGLRESFGNSPEDVAQSTGISVGVLGNLEGGYQPPTGDQVLILADYFKCEFSWLIDDHASNPDENITLLLRNNGGLLAPADRHAVAEFIHLCKSQALLEELLGKKTRADSFQFIPQGNFFKGHGADCAKAFRAHYDLPSNAVIPDIFKWLRNTGLRVFRRSLPYSAISALFIRHPEAGKCILVNFSEDPYRQRFSAAHETGHALLDGDKNFNVSSLEDNSDQDLVEIRANAFASAFLMPRELLLKLGTPEQWRQPEKVIEVAEKLFVTVPAILTALVQSQIIDNETRNELKAMRLKLPAKIEPELGISLAEKQRQRKTALLASGLHYEYVDLAFDAYRRQLISLAKVAEMLLVEPSEVAELAALFEVSLNHA